MSETQQRNLGCMKLRQGGVHVMNVKIRSSVSWGGPRTAWNFVGLAEDSVRP